MGVENDVTKKIIQLEENKDVTGLEKIKNDAEIGFDGEVVGLAEEAINRLNSEVKKITQPVEISEDQKKQIENIGGSEGGLQEVVASIDEKIDEKDTEIENIKIETLQKIKEVENQGETKINYQEKKEELESEIAGLLDQISINLPNQLSEIYNSESYKKLLDLHEKRKVEEKSLWESYDKYTKDGEGSHRRVHFYLGEYGEQVEFFMDDLKFFNAPKDLLKRFEEYKEKFKIPENNAQEKFMNETYKPLNEVKWDLEKTLVSKTKEIFGKDYQAAEGFQKKFFDMYQVNFDKAVEDVIPGKKLHINTKGTIYNL